MSRTNFKKVPCVNAFEQPSKIHRLNKDFYISESLIAYDEKTATLVFFLSDVHGGEYGQYPTLEEAKAAAKEKGVTDGHATSS